MLTRLVDFAAPKLVHEAGPTMVGVSCLFQDPDSNIVSVYGIIPRATFEAAQD